MTDSDDGHPPDAGSGSDDRGDDRLGPLQPSPKRRSVLKALALAGSGGGGSLSASRLASALRSSTPGGPPLGTWQVVQNHQTVDEEGGVYPSHVNTVFTSFGVDQGNLRIPDARASEDPADVAVPQCEDGQPGIEHRFVVTGFSLGERTRVWDPETQSPVESVEEGLSVHDGISLDVDLAGSSCGNVSFAVNNAIQTRAPLSALQSGDGKRIGEFDRGEVESSVEAAFEDRGGQSLQSPKYPSEKFPVMAAAPIALTVAEPAAVALLSAVGISSGGIFFAAAGVALGVKGLLDTFVFDCNYQTQHRLEDDSFSFEQDDVSCRTADSDHVVFHLLDFTVTVPPGESATVTIDQGVEYTGIDASTSDYWENGADGYDVGSPGEFVRGEKQWTLEIPALDLDQDVDGLTEDDLPEMREGYEESDVPEVQIDGPETVSVGDAPTFETEVNGADPSELDVPVRWRVYERGRRVPLPRIEYGTTVEMPFPGFAGDTCEPGGNPTAPVGAGEYVLEARVVDDEGRVGVAAQPLSVVQDSGRRPKADFSLEDRIPQHRSVELAADLVDLDGSEGFEMLEWRVFTPGDEEPEYLYGPNPSYTFDETGVYVVELGAYSVVNRETFLDLANQESVDLDSPPDEKYREEVKDFTRCSSYTEDDGERGGADFVSRTTTVFPSRALDPSIEVHPTTPAVTDEVTLSASVGVDGDSVETYRWEVTGPPTNIPKPDGESGVLPEWSATGERFRHTFSYPGEYHVELTVLDEDDRTATVETSFTLQSLDASIGGPDHRTVGQEGEYWIQVGDEYEDPSITWSGDVSGTGRFLTTTFDAVGSKAVRAEVETDEGSTTLEKTVAVTDEPTISVSGPDRLDPGEDGTFHAEADDPDGGPVDHHWEFGDGHTVRYGGTEQSHAYGDDGTYVVTVTADDDEGEMEAGTHEVQVGAPPEVEITSAPSTLSAGDPWGFQADVTDPDDGVITEVVWDFDDGEVERGESVRHAFEERGTYVVTVTATDDEGEKTTERATVTVYPPQAPSVSIEAASEAVATEPVDFYATSIDADSDVVAHHWDFGDGTTETVFGSDAGTEAVTHTFEDPGDYVVTVEAEDDDGLTGTDEHGITVTTDGVAPGVAIARSPDEVPENQTVQFEAEGFHPDGDPIEYTWTFGDDRTATGASPSHAFADPGEYTVTVTVEDPDGDTDSDETTVTVTEAVEPTATLSGPSTVEPGEKVDLRADADDGDDPGSDGIVQYTWFFDDGSIRSTTTPTVTHRYDAEGKYAPKVVVEDDDGQTAEATHRVTVQERATPTANVVVRPEDPTVDRELNFLANGTDPDGDGFESVEWTFGDGGTATGWQATHVYESPGRYEVEVTVTDRDGDAASDDITLYVEEAATKPDVEIVTAPAEAWADEPASFEATATDPGGESITRFEWHFGDGQSALGRSVGHLYGEPGEFIVEVRAVDADGDVGSARTTVTVEEARPRASISGPNVASVGERVEFTATGTDPDGGSIVGYTWQFNDGSWERDAGPTARHAFDSPGTYEVSLRVEDDDGQTRTTTHEISIGEAFDVAVAEDEYATTVGSDLSVRASVSHPDGRSAVKTLTWTFGDGETATGRAVSHAYGSPGEYDLAVRAVDDEGEVVTDGATVTVEEALSPAIDGPGTVAPGETLTLSVDVDGGETFEWSFGDGETRTTASNSTTYSYAGTGTYRVSVTVTDETGATGTATHEVTVSEPREEFAVSVDGPETVILDSVPEFVAETTVPDGRRVAGYEWRVDGLTPPGDHGRVFRSPLRNLGLGIHVVSVTVTDEAGRSTSDTHRFEVTDGQRPTVSVDGPSDADPGESVTFTAEAEDPDGDAIQRYRWQFGDGDRTTTPTGSATHAFDDDGSYLVKVAAVDDDGEVGRAVHGIHVGDGQGPTVEIVGAPRTGRVGEKHRFDAVVSHPENRDVDSVEWSFGTGDTITGRTVGYVYQSPGTYEVEVVATDVEGNVGSDAVTIEVMEDGGPEVRIDGPDAVAANARATFTVTASDPDHSGPGSGIEGLQWDFGDGTVYGPGEPPEGPGSPPGGPGHRPMGEDHAGDPRVGGDPEPRPVVPPIGDDGRATASYFYDSQGEYTVEVTAVDDEGETAVATHQVTVDGVNEAPTVSVDGPDWALPDEEVTVTAEAEDPDGTIAGYEWRGRSVVESDGATAQIRAIGRRVEAQSEVGGPPDLDARVYVTDDDGAVATATPDVEVVEDPVDVSLSGPSEADVGETVTFEATPETPDGVEVTEYRWTFGDGSSTTTTDPAVDHVYDDPDAYEVEVVAADGDGHSESATHRLGVGVSGSNDPPEVSIDAPDRLPPGGGRRVTANATDEDGYVAKYEWDGVVDPHGDSALMVAPEEEGITMRIGVTVTDDDGATASAEHTYDVGEPDDDPDDGGPSVSLVGTEKTTVGSPATFTAETSTGGDSEIASFEWHFGDGTTTTTTSPTAEHVFESADEYTVTVIVEDSEARTAKDHHRILVEPGERPLPDVSVDAPDSLLPGESATVEASLDGDGDRVAGYEWSGVDATDGETATVTAPSEPSGSPVTPTVTVSFEGGATRSATASIPVTSLSVSLSGPKAIQEGGTASFEASVSASAADLTFEWRFGDGEATTTTAQEVAHEFDSPGGFTVEVVATTEWGWTTSDEHVLTVRGTNLPPTVEIQGPAKLELEETGDYTAVASDEDGTVETYDWSGVDTASGAAATVTAPASPDDGPIEVAVTVTDDDGATATATASVEVTTGFEN